jgi:hypothetical protein
LTTLALVSGLLLLATLPGIPTARAQVDERTTCTQQGGRFFETTGYCVSGPILDYWNANGGLAVFGYPLSPQQREYIGLLTPVSLDQFVAGQFVQAQHFERNRLELHDDGQVTVGRLGADILAQQGRDWFTFPRSGPQPGCEFFEVDSGEGHNICGQMLDAWNAYGGLAMVGLPLSGEVRETLEDGNEYVVQWFERARFQITPGVGVQLGRLGALDLCSNVPPPVNADLSPSNCNIQGVSVDTVLYGFVPNSSVRVWAVRWDGLITSPDGFEGNAGYQTADENGTLVMNLGTMVDTQSGIIYFVFQGDNGRTAIVYLKGISPQFTPFDTSVLHPCVGVPSATNATVFPIDENRQRIEGRGAITCATPDISALGVWTNGFQPGETVLTTLTTPDGENISSELIADESGTALLNGNVPRFSADNYRSRPGLYNFFLQGTQSGRIAAAPIMLTNEDAPALDSTLRLTNASSQTICYVFFSRTTNNNWGVDQLEPDEVVAPGAIRDFAMSAGTYDVRLLDCNGDELFDRRGINISGFYEVRFDG